MENSSELILCKCCLLYLELNEFKNQNQTLFLNCQLCRSKKNNKKGNINKKDNKKLDNNKKSSNNITLFNKRIRRNQLLITKTAVRNNLSAYSRKTMEETQRKILASSIALPVPDTKDTNSYADIACNMTCHATRP